MFAVLFVLINTVLLSVIIHFLFKGSDIVLDVFIALLLSLCLFYQLVIISYISLI